MLFVDLGNDYNNTAECESDMSGPPESKYCADSGAYYAYNLIESGDLDGYLDYPWGATKLSNLDLNISVRDFQPTHLTYIPLFEINSG